MDKESQFVVDTTLEAFKILEEIDDLQKQARVEQQKQVAFAMEMSLELNRKEYNDARAALQAARACTTRAEQYAREGHAKLLTFYDLFESIISTYTNNNLQ